MLPYAKWTAPTLRRNRVRAPALDGGAGAFSHATGVLDMLAAAPPP